MLLLCSLHFCCFLTLNERLCLVYFPRVLNEIIERFAGLGQQKRYQICLLFLFSFVYVIKKLNKNSVTSNWVRHFLVVAFYFFFGKQLLGSPGHMIFQLLGRYGLKISSGMMQLHLNSGGAHYGEQNHHLCICICYAE